MEEKKTGPRCLRFTLPFFPKLTEEDIELADRLRTTEVPEQLKGSFSYPTKAGPMYALKTDGTLNMNVPMLVEEDYSLRDQGDTGDTLDGGMLKGLGDYRFIIHDVHTCFANMFNKRQVQKCREDPSYRPFHMFTTYFLQKLCFRLPYDGEIGNNYSALQRKYKPNDANMIHSNDANTYTQVRRRLNNKATRKTRGAMNIFECNKLFFPFNETNTHYIFFVLILIHSNRNCTTVVGMTWGNSLETERMFHSVFTSGSLVITRNDCWLIIQKLMLSGRHNW